MQKAYLSDKYYKNNGSQFATRTSVKESTKVGYRTTLNFIRKKPFSQKRIDKVKQPEVKLWLLKLQQENGKCYSSIRNIRSVLEPAFQMAVDDDLIRKNPFAFPLGQVIRDDTKKRIVLTQEQKEQFLSFVHEHPHYSRYYEGVYILLNTGFRVSMHSTLMLTFLMKYITLYL